MEVDGQSAPPRARAANAKKFPDVTESGDLVGRAVQGNVYATTANGMYALGTAGSFDGMVKECGIGTFAYSGRGLLDAQLEGKVTYTLVPGTGTGDLEGITGKVDAMADGTLAGVLRCRRH